MFNCPLHGISSADHCPFCVTEKIDTEVAIKTTEGRKNDTDKIRLELIPPEALFGIASVLTRGAIKYEDRNWEKGMAWGRVFGACLRHLWAWWGHRTATKTNFAFGDIDSEWGYSHLWHAGCCLMFLITFEERQIGKDDRP